MIYSAAPTRALETSQLCGLMLERSCVYLHFHFAARRVSHPMVGMSVGVRRISERARRKLLLSTIPFALTAAFAFLLRTEAVPLQLNGSAAGMRNERSCADGIRSMMTTVALTGDRRWRRLYTSAQGWSRAGIGGNGRLRYRM